jgi:hypothetical protein
MNPPTTDMVNFNIRMLQMEDHDLGEAIFELRRSLTSEWSAEDLPRAVRELLPSLVHYRSTTKELIKYVEESFADAFSVEKHLNTP